MISIRVEGDTRKLLKKAQHLSDIDRKSINKSLGETVRASTRERFKKEKNPDNKKWKKSLRASSQGGVTLTKTAALRNSIRSKADASGFAVGTNLIYGRTHQFGEDGRKITIKARTSKGLVFKIGDKWIRKKKVTVTVKIPAREFLGINEDDMKEIKSTLEDVLMEES